MNKSFCFFFQKEVLFSFVLFLKKRTKKLLLNLPRRTWKLEANRWIES